MRERRRPHGYARLAGLIAALAVGALATGLIAPRPARADASGCTLHPATHPTDDANCAGGGNGCYLCEYSYQNGGYTTCSESPDGTESYCLSGQHALNSYSGSRWIPATPLGPVDGARGSQHAPRIGFEE